MSTFRYIMYFTTFKDVLGHQHYSVHKYDTVLSSVQTFKDLY